jgi:hypothetical protein
MRRLIAGLVAALVLGLAPAARAVEIREFFVSNTATCGESCNGSQEKPWTTIKKANEEVKPTGAAPCKDYIFIERTGVIYKEKQIRLNKGESGKCLLDFIGCAKGQTTCPITPSDENCTLVGPKLEECPKVEGEVIFERSNTVFIIANVENSLGPCYRLNKGLTEVGTEYTEEIKCKAEGFANWFGSSIFAEFLGHEIVVLEPGAVKMRPDVKDYSCNIPCEKANSTFYNENTAMVRSYTGGPPKQFEETGGVEDLEPVTMYNDWNNLTGNYAPLTATTRSNYIKNVVEGEVQAQGFAGIVQDDLNLRCGHRNNQQKTCVASEEPGVLTAAGSEFLELIQLMKGIRSQLKPGAVYEANPRWDDIWPILKANTETAGNHQGKCAINEEWKSVCEKAEAGLKELNLATTEEGVRVDQGETEGGEKEAKEFLAYWKALHALGLHTVITGPLVFPESTHNTVRNEEWNLAAYFLVNDGKDYVTGWGHVQAEIFGGVTKALPREKPLGSAGALEGPDANKVYKRKFSKGTVYWKLPSAANVEETITCKESVEWGAAETTVKLKPSFGAVCHS